MTRNDFTLLRHVETALVAMDSSIKELGAGNLVQGHLASQQAIQQVHFKSYPNFYLMALIVNLYKYGHISYEY